MCSTRKSASISGRCSDYLKQFAFDEDSNIQSENISNNLLSIKISQPSEDKVQAIRSNKNIIKKHLRNSLLIPKHHYFLNVKEQNSTAASLKNLDSDTQSSSDKQGCEKQNQSKFFNSSKSFSSPTQRMISDIFNERYTILKKLGQGAHSTVYKCSEKIDQKIYALKQIKNVSYQNWIKLKNLYRMIKNINHQSIIKYHDYYFDQQKRTAYVVMEYCEFTDLRCQLTKKLLNNTPFKIKEILQIVKKIADALQYLHNEGICHRDLKPQNILYCKKSGLIKIIDLDVCGVKKLKCQKFDMWTSTGTLFYRAPQSFEIGYTQKVDIWSLGIIIYQLYTGKLPFQTQYQRDFLDLINNRQIDFNEISSDTKFNALLKKCLQKDENKRISAFEISNFLKLVTKDDDFLFKANRYETQRKRTSYSDTYMNIVCLGNLLKLTY